MQNVLALSQAGKSVRDIAEELGMGKSKVHRLLKKAQRLEKAKPVESEA